MINKSIALIVCLLFIGSAILPLASLAEQNNSEEINALPNPVAEWKFNENTGQVAGDTSGNGNDAQLGFNAGADAGDPTWVAGFNGSALSFDGNSLVVTPIDISPAAITELTASAWIKVPGVPAAQEAIISNDNGGYDRAIMLHPDGDYRIFGGAAFDTNVPLNYGAWEFVTATWNTTAVTFYVNGQLAYSAGGETVDVGGETRIGTNSGGMWDYNGLIDEVSVFDKALNESEVLELYLSNGEVHNIDSGEIFNSIQNAIDDTDTLNGHTITVGAGTYNEKVTITKSLTIIGNGSADTTINGDGTFNVVNVTNVNWVNISGFEIAGAGNDQNNDNGIYLSNADYCRIEHNNFTSTNNCNNIGLMGSNYNVLEANTFTDGNKGIRLQGNSNNNYMANSTMYSPIGIALVTSIDNTMTNNSFFGGTYGVAFYSGGHSNIVHDNKFPLSGTGVFIWLGNGNTITNNTITGAGNGISLNSASCMNNHIANNTIQNGTRGISIYTDANNNTVIDNKIMNNSVVGIRILSSARNNTINNNNISNNTDGIYLDVASNNTFTNNNVTMNTDTGMNLTGSADNLIYHNNFIDNTNQAWDDSLGNNSWDNGYPSGGNYWADYGGVDAMYGPAQDMPGSDSLGDAPYTNILGGTNLDNYPLMNPTDFIDATAPTSSVDVITPYWLISGQIINATASDSGSGVANVTLWYRYCADNITWNDWTPFDLDTDISDGWSWDFTFPNGDGYYEFFSIANDTVGNMETMKAAAEEECGFDSTAPAVDAGDDAISNSQFTQDATVTGTDIATYEWTQLSGIGTITFGTPDAEDTTISADIDGTYIIQLKVTDTLGNWAVDDFTLTWDTTAPVINITSVVNETGITFTLTDDNPGMAYYIEGTNNISLTTPFIDTSGLSEGWYNYTIWATDLAMNTATEDVTIYIEPAIVIDTTPPTIISTSPTDGAINVSTSGDIVITFSQPMDTASVQSAFGITNITSNATTMSFAWNTDNTTLTVSISPRLDPVRTYTVIIDTGAQDANSTAMASNYSFSFTTFVDTDEDGITDSDDTDKDGDGTPDATDAFPLDPDETLDTDGDGIGNNADPDDDDDGVGDAEEIAAGTDPLDDTDVPDTGGGGGITDYWWIILVILAVVAGAIIGFMFMGKKGTEEPDEVTPEEEMDDEETQEDSEDELEDEDYPNEEIDEVNPVEEENAVSLDEPEPEVSE